MTKAVRGEVWAVDFEPQTHRQEPGKKERPALVIQTDALNKAGHPTTIVVPGTSQVDALPRGDHFPLRVRIQKTADLKHDTDLFRRTSDRADSTKADILAMGAHTVATAFG